MPTQQITGPIQINYTQPFVNYKDTKANIEALTGIAEGAIAYSTDTDELGSYNGATWTWGTGGSTDVSGWAAAPGTWTYASATTITVPTDATTVYQKGMKIRLKQGGAYKYFYILTVAATLLTVTGGSDYTVANAAITDVGYSVAATPLGFPDWLNYTWSANGGGTMTLASTTQIVGDFKIDGLQLTVRISGTTTTGGTAHAEIRVTTPVDVANADAVLPQLASTYDTTSKLGYAYIYETGTPHKVTIIKYDGSVWGLGAGRGFRALINTKIA